MLNYQWCINYVTLGDDEFQSLKPWNNWVGLFWKRLNSECVISSDELHLFCGNLWSNSDYFNVYVWLMDLVNMYDIVIIFMNQQ